MIYLFERSDQTYVVFTSIEMVPEYMRNKLIEVHKDQVPTGDGFLRRDYVTGEFYLYNPPSPEPKPEQPVELEQPKPELSLEEMQAKTLLNTEVLIAMKNIGV